MRPLRSLFPHLSVPFSTALLIFAILKLTGAVSAAVSPNPDLSVPKTWLNPTSPLSRAEREALAASAAAVLVAHIDHSSGSVAGLEPSRSAQLVSVLALQDAASGNTTLRGQVADESLAIYAREHPGYAQAPPDTAPYGVFNGDTMVWGLAAAYAYRAYGTQALLDIAVANWELTSGDAVTSTEVAPRDASLVITRECLSTLQGAVFDAHLYRADPAISTYGTAMYATLSAYLFEATHDAKYLAAAELSIAFLHTRLSTADGHVLHALDASTCKVADLPYSWNYGTYIEALAALSTHNGSWAQPLREVVLAATKNAGWNLPDGRMAESFPGPPPFEAWGAVSKRHLIRGLAEARARNPGTDLATPIEAYVLVQFNSLLNSAADKANSFYATEWTGPAPAAFNASGSIAALEVLNAAFSFLVPPQDTRSPSSAPASPNAGASGAHPTPGADPSAPQASSHGRDIGAIVGGVLGALAAFGAGLTAILVYRRRRRQCEAARESTSADPFDVSPPVPGDAYLLPASKELPPPPLEPYARVLPDTREPSASETDAAGAPDALHVRAVSALVERVNAALGSAAGDGRGTESRGGRESESEYYDDEPPPDYVSTYAPHLGRA